MLGLEEFIAKYYKGINPRDIVTSRTYYKEFTEMLDRQEDKERALNNREFVMSFFYLRRTSPTVFYQQKAFLRNYYNECAHEYKIVPEIMSFIKFLRMNDAISTDKLKTYYFRDLDDLLEYIIFVGRQYGFYENDSLLQHRAVSILSWHGILPDDMQYIKRVDMFDEAHSIFVKKRGESIVLDPKYYKVVREFADSESYFGFPSKKPLVYKPSIYLFRSGYKDSMTLYNINQIIQRFNNEAAIYGKLISLKTMRTNAMFDKVRRLSLLNGSTVFELLDSLGYRKRERYAYKRLYLEWLSLFW